MSATLKVAREVLGVEVRRGTFDVVLDGEHVGSIEVNGTFNTAVDPGHHTLQIRNGRNSSRVEEFDAVEDHAVSFRCGGKRFLPIFLASFFVPSLALSLRRE